MTVSVLCLFLVLSRIGLRSLIVAFPGHAQLLFSIVQYTISFRGLSMFGKMKINSFYLSLSLFLSLSLSIYLFACERLLVGSNIS